MYDAAPLYQLSRTVTMHWANPENYEARDHAGGKSNSGRKGSPCRGVLKAGETWTLAEARGTGTVRRIWITMSQRDIAGLRGLTIRAFWDGQEKPAIEAPIGDFFGCPLGRNLIFESAWFNNPEGRSYNSFIPMPFRTGFKITVSNDSPQDQAMFWYHIDYTLGDAHNDDTGYLHAHWRRENLTKLCEDFEILPRVDGRGRFLGCNIGVVTDNTRYRGSWWGEGEMKIFLDGDTEFPTLCGTGTEDYICTAWGQGQFQRQWYGCPLADNDRGQYAFYRLHGPDPIFFQQHCRATMQQIGWGSYHDMLQHHKAAGQDHIVLTGDGGRKYSDADIAADPEKAKAHGLFEREDDWCATAYFYLDRPAGTLPGIARYEQRIANLTGDPVAIKRQDA
ncbi:MAG: DUF2961 domain-containing protein [Planctomycetota bacterium]|nr:DUF2961 domain-containing protein [Planctomycetota bacterium]